MEKLESQWIAQQLQTRWQGSPPAAFTGISVDSREIKPGELFVGVDTPSGHRQVYLPQAQVAGATAAIVQNLQPTRLPQLVVADTTQALQQLALARRRQYTGPVIGLTGSSGKTSTKELLAHLLGPQATKTSGNLNNHLGLPLTLLSAPLGASAWVIEAGINKPGDMDALQATLQPTAALLTMIGSAHLEYLKTREGIAQEKGKLLHAVPPAGHVVVHATDVAYPSLRTLAAQVSVLGPGPCPPLPSNYQLVPTSYQETPHGWQLILAGETYLLPLWTPGMARNAALCLRLARQLGIPYTQLQERLPLWTGAQLRGQWLKFSGAPEGSRVYLDAYNSNPEALADSLWRFHRMSPPERPKLYILGTMAELGDESDELHRLSMQQIPTNTHARYICVGVQAPLMAEALKSRGLDAQVAEDLEKIKSLLAAATGDCFIKGSHSTQLHTLSSSCSPL